MKDKQLTEFLHQVEQVLTKTGGKDFSGKRDYGIVTSVADGVITIEGLPGLRMSEIVKIKDTKANALVMNLEQGVAKALLLSEESEVSEGVFVMSTGELLSLPVGEAVVSRVIDPLGNPLDGRGAIKSSVRYPLEKVAPGVITRESVNQPLQTGYTSIDALVPIGRGQRELIIGDRQTGKTTVAIDTIINQKESKVV